MFQTPDEAPAAEEKDVAPIATTVEEQEEASQHHEKEVDEDEACLK